MSVPDKSSNPDLEDWPYVNGTVWYHPTWCHYTVLTYLCGKTPAWCRMAIEPATHGGFCQIAMSEKSGKDRYTFEELPDLLDKWECMGVWWPTEYQQYGYKEPK